MRQACLMFWTSARVENSRAGAKKGPLLLSMHRNVASISPANGVLGKSLKHFQTVLDVIF